MTRIYIVRHGLSKGNLDKVICGHHDTPLTDFGRQQAELVGKHFSKLRIDKVYSSDLSRALETAKIIAKHTNHEPIIDPLLRERACGIFDGLPVDVALAHPQWVGFISKPHENVDGGETIAQVYKRSRELLDKMVKAHDGEEIVLVTHGGWLWVTIPVVLGIDINNYYGFIGMDNCSISTVVYDNGYFVLENLNMTSHLGDGKHDALSWRF
jgi:broad specificity phosphatase PhoE